MMNGKPVAPRRWGRIGKRAMGFRQTAILLLVGMMAGVSLSGQAAEGVVLQSVDYSALPGNKVQIILNTSAPVGMPATFTTDNPARIALDFTGMKNGLPKRTEAIGVGMARSVTAVEAGGRTRVVINLVAAIPHEIRLTDNGVLIALGGDGGTAKVRPMSDEGAAAVAVTAPVATGRRIENVDFRRGEKGEGRVIVSLSDPSTAVDMREEGGTIVLELMDVSLPERLMRRFDVGDFATPVKAIEVSPQDGNARLVIMPRGDYEHLAYQADNLYTVEFRPLTEEEKEAVRKKKKVYVGERLSLNFQDIEVRAVLQLLADFTGLNLVTSDTVTGKITLRLKNVPWDQAMEIILKTKGLSMRRTENVILVAPTEEIAAREKLELESQQQIEELAPLRSEFVQINYAKAEDLATLLKSEDNKLLSERGNVTIDQRTNTLLIQDTDAKLEEIGRLIRKLDIPVRQVLIESRVVLANNDFSDDIGMRFGISGGDGGSDWVTVGGGKSGHMGGTFQFIENPAESTQEALLVNLPETLGGERGGAINLLLGKVGSALLQLELSAMQQEGKGEVVASPRVITSDQSKAIIQQGVEIPYQEASSSGATSVSFKEAVLKLEVTPHITPDDRVIMDLVVNKDSPDFSNEVLGVPPVNTQKVETSVLVDSGETVVLGGVYELNKTTNREQIPLLGDIPMVGFLFSREAHTDNHQELLIFVTPKILKESLGAL